MPFAPEDKRAWDASEVMAELEKVAAELGTLDGPPPEAFEPLRSKEADDGSWESWEDDGDAPAAPAQEADDAPGPGEVNGLGEYASELRNGLYAMADNLRRAGRSADSLMFERAADLARRSGDLRLSLRETVALASELDRMGKEKLAEAADRLALKAAEAFKPAADAKDPQEEGEDAPHQA